MKKYNKIFYFLGILFIYLFSNIFYLLPFKIFRIDLQTISITNEVLLMILRDTILSVILFLIYKDYLINKFHDFKKNFKKYFNCSLKYWFIGLLLMYITNLLLYIFNPVKEVLNENAVQDLISQKPYLTFLLTTIFAPFTEEIIFRKSLKDAFSNNYVFIILSGLIFGFLHVSGGSSFYDYLYIIPYATLGSTFAYILTKTNNIYCTILVHLIHNGILTILSILV